jgi:hypothetical protein
VSFHSFRATRRYPLTKVLSLKALEYDQQVTPTLASEIARIARFVLNVVGVKETGSNAAIVELSKCLLWKCVHTPVWERDSEHHVGLNHMKPRSQLVKLQVCVLRFKLFSVHLLNLSDESLQQSVTAEFAFSRSYNKIGTQNFESFTGLNHLLHVCWALPLRFLTWRGAGHRARGGRTLKQR